MSLYGARGLVPSALDWDVGRVRTCLNDAKPSASCLQEAILGCVLKATGNPFWQETLLLSWKPYKTLQEQLTWCYQGLPGPSPLQLQVVQELVQHAGNTARKGLGYTALQMAAASGCAPLLRVLLQQPSSSSAAGAASSQTLQQADSGRTERAPPYLRRMHPNSSSSGGGSSRRRLLVLPPAVGLTEVVEDLPQELLEVEDALAGKEDKEEEEVDTVLPGPLELAAASGSAEAVEVLLAAGYSVHGLAGGTDPEQLLPIHWAAAVRHRPAPPRSAALHLQPGSAAVALPCKYACNAEPGAFRGAGRLQVRMFCLLPLAQHSACTYRGYQGARPPNFLAVWLPGKACVSPASLCAVTTTQPLYCFHTPLLAVPGAKGGQGAAGQGSRCLSSVCTYRADAPAHGRGPQDAQRASRPLHSLR